MFTSSNHANESNANNFAPENINIPDGYSNHTTNGVQHSHSHPPPAAAAAATAQSKSQPSQLPKETINVVGIPSVSIQNGKLVVGDARSSSHRSYTPIKTLGDGSFGTVLLCDWHGTLPPNTPLSPMQCGGGARPEWAGKRLVAVKRMKKKWEGGWDECKRLKELELYDFFLLPDTKELYFVFESMEGNLYHLIKARKGRALAGGLVASIFKQIVSGLHHIHASGYFHRDMKPENVLVTTTEKDVVAIIKLADFGLARETASAPPYTEYVSTRWYRAPEVLLLSRDYSNPVDMWALGTIMAELVNLRPLFPGSDQIDQIHRICEVLGDPADYGSDPRGRSLGGGKWIKGLKMARQFNFTFPKCQPKDFPSYFDRSVPRKLIECISDLLKYDPDARLTSRQCLEHPYLIEALPHNVPPMPPALHVQTLPATPSKSHTNRAPYLTPSVSPRSVPPSHSHNSLPKSPLRHPQSSTHLMSQTLHPPTVLHSYLRSSPQPHTHLPRTKLQNTLTTCIYMRMELSSPLAEVPEDTHAMDVQTSIPPRPEPMPGLVPAQDTSPAPISKLGRLGSFGFGKKNSKWSLGVFGHGEKVHQQSLPPVDEVPGSSSTPSLKRTQSTNSDSPSVSDVSPANARRDAKAIRKEAQRLQLEADKQRRAMAERAHREQARAVMQKRNQMLMQTTGRNELEWKWSHSGSLISVNSRPNYDDLDKGKLSASGPIRQNQSNGSLASSDRWLPRDERLTKVRRRDFDDDHSMSSSDIHSTGRTSAISFATVDSDPGPTRVRRPTLYGINRMTSASSLRTGTTSFDDFPTSARSSNSISLDHQFNEFSIRASVDTTSSVSGTSSPPPINLLSLSPSPNSWMHSHNSHDSASPQHPSYVVVPPRIQYPSSSHNSYECNGQLYGHPPIEGIDPHAAINPIFKVTPLPTSPSEHLSSPHPLPPFSYLEAVAEGEYPPLSPMSFHSPEDE
ncbi:Pkinase-domain-containing protein [Melanogaster broomeanus]|nr:Pkinase-domain-containing protein [Melanogaster broomeanus]